MAGLNSLGLVSDIYNTGFTSASANYAGDYATALGIEGFIMQWTELGSTQGPTVNEDIQGYCDVAPSSFKITSNGNTLSSLWIGSYGNIVVKKATYFNANDFHFRTSVTVKNVGPNAMSNLYCKSFPLLFYS